MVTTEPKITCKMAVIRAGLNNTTNILARLSLSEPKYFPIFHTVTPIILSGSS